MNVCVPSYLTELIPFLPVMSTALICSESLENVKILNEGTAASPDSKLMASGI